jgi:hypothetical protein
MPGGTFVGNIVAKSGTGIFVGPLAGFATPFTCAAPGPGGGYGPPSPAPTNPGHGYGH